MPSVPIQRSTTIKESLRKKYRCQVNKCRSSWRVPIVTVLGFARPARVKGILGCGSGIEVGASGLCAQTVAVRDCVKPVVCA